jgi:hypothetical protein
MDTSWEAIRAQAEREKVIVAEQRRRAIREQARLLITNY